MDDMVMKDMRRVVLVLLVILAGCASAACTPRILSQTRSVETGKLIGSNAFKTTDGCILIDAKLLVEAGVVLEIYDCARCIVL